MFLRFPGSNIIDTAITVVRICIVGVVFISLFVSRGIINPIIILLRNEESSGR